MTKEQIIEKYFQKRNLCVGYEKVKKGLFKKEHKAIYEEFLVYRLTTNNRVHDYIIFQNGKLLFIDINYHEDRYSLDIENNGEYYYVTSESPTWKELYDIIEKDQENKKLKEERRRKEKEQLEYDNNPDNFDWDKLEEEI